MTPKIQKGNIRCKFCNNPKASAISQCTCGLESKWNMPNGSRTKSKEAQLKKDGEIITPPSKEFLKAMRDKKSKQKASNLPSLTHRNSTILTGGVSNYGN